jgi:hypothetical protein
MDRTAYRTADVDGLKVFYRDAGPPDAPSMITKEKHPMRVLFFRDHEISELRPRFRRDLGSYG